MNDTNITINNKGILYWLISCVGVYRMVLSYQKNSFILDLPTVSTPLLCAIIWIILLFLYTLIPAVTNKNWDLLRYTSLVSIIIIIKSYFKLDENIFIFDPFSLIYFLWIFKKPIETKIKNSE
ncbi:hypothetical protein PIPA1_16390 [Pelosinus sp. IPA-1]|nr:hypothetical protein PIPA1_16390 [Pelosinus sp. IPA-1]